MRSDTVEFNSYKQAAHPTFDFLCDGFDRIVRISNRYYFQMAYPLSRIKPIISILIRRSFKKSVPQPFLDLLGVSMAAGLF